MTTNYTIIKVVPKDNYENLMVTFRNGQSNTTLNMKEYDKYGRPTVRHVVEPDGNVFVCAKHTIRTPRLHLGSRHRCNMHNTLMGCKFHLGITDSFTHRTKKELDHCRCYCRLATQYEYDKWCYNDCIKNDRPLDDNAKIYKKLTHY